MIDPLTVSINTRGVDTRIPLLPEADYVFQISESSVDANKDENGLNWNLKLATTSPITAVDGREVKPNHTMFAMPVALQAKEGTKDPEFWLKNLCSQIDAVFGTDMDTRPEFTNPELVQAAAGKLVIGHVAIEPYNGENRNKVTKLKPYVG